MDVPLSLILDALSKHAVQSYVPASEKRVYKGVSMMPDPPFELVKSLLHVSLLSVVIRAGGLEEGQTCVCLRDREHDALETDRALRGLIIIDTVYPMEYIFHEIHNVFILLSDWERAMLDCIIHKDLVSLAALGETMTRCRILVLDSSLSLLALSSAEAERLYQQIAADRHNQPLLFGRETQAGAPTGNAIRVVRNGLMPGQALAVATVEINASYRVYVMADTGEHAVDTAILDRFGLFVPFVTSFVKNRLINLSDGVRVYDRLIAELVEGRVTHPNIIKSRCEMAGLRNQTPYRLFCIQFDQSEQASATQAMDELCHLLPDARVFRYEHQILAISYGDKPAEEEQKSGLAPFCQQHSAVCGVSGQMYDMASLKTAYEQTALAVEYGQRVRQNRILADQELEDLSIVNDGNIFRYEDYALYRIADAGAQRKAYLLTNSFCLCALAKLWLNDKISRLNNLKLLYVYLLTERQGTLTAKILHMHRNNVYYHMTRIEELTDLDLANPELRANLLMTYRLLDLYGADYLGTSDYYNSLDTEILRDLCAMNNTKWIKKALGTT